MDDKEKSILIKCARTYVSIKKWDKAIEEYEKLRFEAPDDPNIIEQLAICYFNTGKIPSYRLMINKAIDIYISKENFEKARLLKEKLK
jgi:tetratricopeptide (TPR) repeat protein